MPERGKLIEEIAEKHTIYTVEDAYPAGEYVRIPATTVENVKAALRELAERLIVASCGFCQRAAEGEDMFDVQPADSGGMHRFGHEGGYWYRRCASARLRALCGLVKK